MRKSIIEKALALWHEKGNPNLAMEDWVIIGKALEEGRRKNRSKKSFGAWVTDNGFDDIPANYRTEAMWLVSESGQQAMKELGNAGEKFRHPHVLHKAWLAYMEKEVREKYGDITNADLVHKLLGPKKTWTIRQLEEETGIRAELLSRTLNVLKRGGKVKHNDKENTWRRWRKDRDGEPVVTKPIPRAKESKGPLKGSAAVHRWIYDLNSIMLSFQTLAQKTGIDWDDWLEGVRQRATASPGHFQDMNYKNGEITFRNRTTPFAPDSDGGPCLEFTFTVRRVPFEPSRDKEDGDGK